jgi:peptidoglycan/xylan/chitin deacetylase (PgdA/CDA1 family)
MDGLHRGVRRPAASAVTGPRSLSGAVATPRVTVVVPCYNAEATLGRTLLSLRAQSFAAWTAVLVDDGSADRTFEVAQGWAAADPRIQVVRKANGGVASARNAGIAAATGEWLMFLDSDDYLHRHALRRLLGAADANPEADVVYGRGARVDADGRAWRFPEWDLSDPFAVLSGQCALVIHSAIVRRRRVEEVGAFDETLQTSEDWDLWQRIARAGAGFRRIRPLVAFYQSAPGSLSKRVGQLARDTLEVIRRGHAADPRVARPHPAYAAGADPDAMGYLQLNFVLWSAARDIAGGGAGVWLLDLLPPQVLASADVEPEHLGTMLASGMADQLCVQPADLGPRWAEFSQRLQGLLDALYPDAARVRQRDLALLALKSHLGAPLEGGDTAEARSVALAGLDLEAAVRGVEPVGRDAVAIQLRRQGRPLGLLVAPALGALSPADVADRASRQFRGLAMTFAAPALEPWRSPRFWAAALGPLLDLRGLGVALRHDRGQLRGILEQRARFAFVTGAEAVVRARVAAAPRSQPSSHARAVEALRREAGATGAASPAPIAAPAVVRPLQVSVRLPILMYHQVADDGPPALARWRVPVARFAEQMAFLRREGFHTVTPDDWAHALRRNRPLPGRPVMITSDDAYRDFADNAWPILQAQSLSATLFVIAGKVGGVADWDADAGPPAPLLDWAGLRALAGQGVSIGSHSVTHRRLSRLSTREVYEEALRSRAIIAAELGRTPTAFCYPYGAHDRVVAQAVVESGYAMGFTCIPGASTLADNPMRLPRIEINGGDDLVSFSRKVGRPLS